MKEDELVRQAATGLRSILARIPEAEETEVLASEPQRALVDLAVGLRVAGQEWRMLVEVKSSGEPRFAREGTNRLLRALGDSPDAYGVFVAPWISPQAAAICREAGVGYLDLAGNCFLTFGAVYIERTGQPNPFTQSRGLRSLYTAKAERVLRVLLQKPRRQWKLQSLADEAKVSIGQAHKVKSLLLDKEWVSSASEGIALTKPAELLAEWSRNYRHKRNQVKQFYTLATAQEAEQGVLETCAQMGTRCALAGFSAAARLAPFVRYQRGSLYLEEAALARVASTLELKEVATGANLALWVPYDDGVWYGALERNRETMTSPVQTYLDLLSLHSRGEEAAAFLLDREIKPQW